MNQNSQDWVFSHHAFIICEIVDDVVFFANTLGDAQKLIKASEEICMHIKLNVNSSKTNIYL